MSERECCGTCRWSITMPMDEHYCDNEDSESYGLETVYDECCEEWEGKDGRY